MSNFKPDFTAWFVLQGTIAAMHRPDFYDELNREMLELSLPLSDAASKTRFVSRLIHNLPYSWQYNIGEMVTNPGRLRHFYFRKKEIEKQARRMIEEEGANQLVILGAGLDVLSLRLAKQYPEVSFIEIDRAESQQFKKTSLLAGQINIPENVELIAGDLRDPLKNILESSALFSDSKKTLWLAEGFLMFIPEENVVALLKEIKAATAQGGFVLFTSLPNDKQSNSFATLLQGIYLSKENSPVKWKTPIEEVEGFLIKNGLELYWQMPCVKLHERYIEQKFLNSHDFAENIHIAKY